MANKSFFRKILTNFLIIVIVIVVVYIFIESRKYIFLNNLPNTHTNIQNNTTQNFNDNKTEDTNNTQNPWDHFHVAPTHPKIPEDLIFKKNEPVVLDNFTITLTNVKKGKKLSDFGVSKDDLSYNPSWIDDTGSLIYDDEIFIFLTITMENTSSKKIERYVDFFLEDNIDTYMSHECIYKNIRIVGKPYFVNIFEPHEEVEFVLGYAVYDKYDNENLLLNLSNGYYNPYADYDQYFIAINS